MTSALVVAIAARLARNMELADRQHGVFGFPKTKLEPAEAHERLHRRARRVCAAQHAIQQRLVGIVEQQRVVRARDAVDERVRIEARHADHREHFARARIDCDCGARAAFERGFGGLLQMRIDREVKIRALLRRYARLEHAHRSVVRVHLDLLVARLAVQLVFVEALDAGLACVRRARVIALVQAREIVLVDAADVADDMRELLAERIRAREVRHDVDARECPSVDREARDFLFRELQTQRNALVRALAAAERVEARDVLVGQRHDLAKAREHRVHVPDLLGRHFEPERGDVVGEQDAVAVVDEPAPRRERARDDAVRIGAQRKLLVPRDLEIRETHAEPDQARDDDEESRDRAAAKHVRLVARVLERFEHARHRQESLTRSRPRKSSSSRNTNGQSSMPTSGESQNAGAGIGSPEKPRIMMTTMRSLSSSANTASACCHIGKKRSRARNRSTMKIMTDEPERLFGEQIARQKIARKADEEREAEPDALGRFDRPVNQDKADPVRLQRQHVQRERHELQQKRERDAAGEEPGAGAVAVHCSAARG